MTELNGVDTDRLREWLRYTDNREAAEWLMLAIAHEEGVDVDDLESWYDHDAEAIREWFAEVRTDSLVTAIAEKEGIDFEELARAYGLSVETIRDWFEELETEPVQQAVKLVSRYGQRREMPVFGHSESRVQYLNHEVIEAEGWSIDDEDLFEKASNLHLDPDDYGRILAKPGESILEAAENRGFTWPYACRAGACANCAVIVKEGDIAMPGNNVLSDEQVNLLNARLTCVGVPVTDEVKLIMNVQHLERFDDLRLPSPMGGAEHPSAP